MRPVSEVHSRSTTCSINSYACLYLFAGSYYRYASARDQLWRLYPVNNEAYTAPKAVVLFQGQLDAPWLQNIRDTLPQPLRSVFEAMLGTRPDLADAFPPTEGSAALMSDKK